MITAEGGDVPTAFAEVVSALRKAGCVFAEEEARLLLAEATGPEELEGFVSRRAAGIPLEQILGWAEFAGGRILLEPGVFVPRRRTEVLVREAAHLLTAEPGAPPAVVVDLCCGSGAVGAALVRRVPGVELHAADIDSAAVRCARRNVGPLGGHVYEGDLFAALPSSLRGRVQLLAVNAPYVPSGAISTMPPEARLHEPRACLDGGADGLDFHRRVAASASKWLSPHGRVLMETSQQQARSTAAIFSAAGFASRSVRAEDLDGTVLIAQAR